MPVLLASPTPTGPVTPPSKPDLPVPDPYIRSDHFPGLDSITWTGWDGSTWELYCRRHGNGGSGVALGRRVRGLHFGDSPHVTVETAGADGARYVGVTAAPREIFATLRVWHRAGSQEWIEHNRAFWRSMLPARPGVRGPGRFTVTQPNGDQRWIDAYPVHKGDHDYDVDPAVKGWGLYGATWMAYRPYWLSTPPAPRSFEATTASGFFGGSFGGRGPRFIIGDQGKVGAAAIDVPGDEPAWPVWRLHGPFTQARIGTPDALTTVTMNVAAGETITVDTDPLAQSFVDSEGVERIPDRLTGEPFVPLPPGRNVPLVAEITGEGSLDVTVQPLWNTAW